jgi:hypothetical protein
VLRGSRGAAERVVNVPWVKAGKRYHVKGLFSGRDYGTHSAAELEKGLTVALPPYGQELLELAPGA